MLFKMNHKLFFKTVLVLCIGIMSVSCVDDDDFGVPPLVCNEPGIAANKTVQQVFDEAPASPAQFTEDDIIEAYAVSSDEGGNFFKTISFQTLDGSAAFSLSLDETNTYLVYEPGRKVFFKLKDLFRRIDFNQLEIGALFGNDIGRIAEPEVENFLVRSCEIIDEEQLVQRISLNEVSDQYLNRLIEFTDVQFKDNELGGNYFDPNNVLGGATNRRITDAFGFELIFRTSEFADFAGSPVSEGNGTIRGVLTKFNNDFQFFARTEADIQLTNPRQEFNRIGIGALRTFRQDETINDPRFIEGIVTLSGNNEDNITGRNAVLQDETGGIVIRFTADGHSLVEGDRVRILVQGLTVDTFAGQTQLTNIPFNGDVNGAAQVEVLEQNQPLPAPKVVSISEALTNAYESQLIQIDNVQFINDQLALTYSGERNITDCSDNLRVFTRSSASFSGQQVAQGNGSIVGIANITNTTELLLRNLDGVSGMTGARCTEPTPIFLENFESIATVGNNRPVTLTGWQSISTNGGTENWEARSFSGNKYAQASGFGIAEEMNVWLITPAIDLSASSNETFSLEYTQNFYNGDALKVKYSTDYDGSGNPANFTWTEITSDLSITERNTSGFMSGFVKTNEVDISNIQGSVFFAFEYSGTSSGVTTTVQIDNITIKGIN
jgi:hypothetical protein